jgi:hypothetical protein
MQALIISITQHDWDMVDSFTMAQEHNASLAANHTQKQKFDLHIIQHQIDQSGTKQVVVNLTDRTLDTAAISILSKGLNFAQTSNIRSNLKDFISGRERTIQHLPLKIMEEV